ncbi:Gfo/Idh/MocA family oxidoreductase [Sinomonas sp. ASV486]|uniref:Gfo/Idh/MocA family protein n=1 Tax=Sinomonas sp. ASV486 TaxID=3051170 RepID=UPI0027DB8671|nr:Gfo/Idh/MocA family oxidoreductase [Sinomonas sp. ASV486]MDQ4491213.1 Gfo/Idh/MocA family oxidoreductase [Sinomonas sp. ASV486]
MSTVRWGVLTTARIAQSRFLPAAGRASGAAVVAISSTSGRAEEVAGRFGIPAAYGSHEELLADPGVEAVYVPFPNSLHAEWALRAVEAGKHVLCEKPLVASADELAHLAEAAARRGVKVMEAFMYRFHPQHAKVRELLDSGRIGDVVSIHARFHFAMDRQPGEPRLKPGFDGGALNDIGCYGVDALNRLMDAPPRSVYARGTSHSDPVETSMAAILDYGGVLATIDCGFEGPLTNTLQIIGTLGHITLDKAFDPDPTETANVTVASRSGAAETFAFTGDAFQAEIEQFSEWTRSDGPTMPFQELTQRSLAVRVALHASLASGQPQAVIPADAVVG